MHGPLCSAGLGHTVHSNTLWEDRVCGPMESKRDHQPAGLLPGGMDGTDREDSQDEAVSRDSYPQTHSAPHW